MLSPKGAVNQFFKVSVIPSVKAVKGMALELHGVGHMYMVDVSSASDQSPLFSRRNRSLYLLCSPLKLSQETRCNILMYLSVFNFRSLCERCYEAKLKLVVSYSDSFD